LSDIFREVDEEVRHDEYKRLWDRYGLYVIGAGLAIVLGVGGYKGWQAYQQRQAESAGREYIAAASAVEAGRDTEAAKLLAELGAEGPAGYALLARFKMAAVLAGKGQREEAVRAYDEVARIAGEGSPLAELAQMRSALLLVDTADRAELERRLASFDRVDSPWRNTAREILAMAAYRASDYAVANNYFEAIAGDPAAPANVRQRARMMIALLKPLLAPGGAATPAK